MNMIFLMVLQAQLGSKLNVLDIVVSRSRALRSGLSPRADIVVEKAFYVFLVQICVLYCINKNVY